MTGWRIGYAGGPDWLINGMSKVMMQSTSNPSSISKWAAVTALDADQSFLKVWRTSFQTRRDYVISRLDKINGLSCATPDGAFYAYVTAKNAMANMQIKDDVELCERLLTDAHIAVVPAQAFQGQDGFRLSYATDMATLESALNRLENFMS